MLRGGKTLIFALVFAAPFPMTGFVTAQKAIPSSYHRFAGRSRRSRLPTATDWCSPALPTNVHERSNPLGLSTFISPVSLFREPMIDTRQSPGRSGRVQPAPERLRRRRITRRSHLPRTAAGPVFEQQQKQPHGFALMTGSLHIR
jgi:hypothetical protein